MNNTMSFSDMSGGCSFLAGDDQNRSTLLGGGAMADISQQSINCGESRPTFRSRKMSKAKTPSKPRLRERSGRDKSNPGTPSSGSSGDRFIPDVSLLGNEAVHFKLLQEQRVRDEEGNYSNTQENNEDNQVNLGDNNGDGLDSSERFNILTDNVLERCKILNLANQNAVHGTAPKSGFACSSQKSTLTKSKRHIPTAPVKTLDAPDLSNDFYLNLMDWANSNYLTVALANGVYMWNASSGEIVDLVELDESQLVTSVKFHDQSTYIAVGVSDGSVLIFNSETKQKLRTLRGHSHRVSCLDWNGSLLCSGARSGNILVHDTVSANRNAQHLLTGHTQEVCSLKWNDEKSYLASGSADSSVKIWSLNQGTGGNGGNEEASTFLTNTLTGHIAAVKALTWVNSSSSVIISGGGSADRCIKVWNVVNGRCVKSVDTGSQVTQLGFNGHYDELISTHGYPSNVLSIWKYPFLNKVKELPGHTGRILHMCMSPDGEIVASAAEDETIRLWEVFARDIVNSKTKKSNATKVLGNSRNTQQSAAASSSLLMMHHR